MFRFWLSLKGQHSFCRDVQFSASRFPFLRSEVIPVQIDHHVQVNESKYGRDNPAAFDSHIVRNGSWLGVQAVHNVSGALYVQPHPSPCKNPSEKGTLRLKDTCRLTPPRS